MNANEKMTREQVLQIAKPILFNTEMVRAIQNDRKTVTRRIAFPNNDLREFHSEKYPNGWWLRGRVYNDWDSVMWDIKREYLTTYKVGDVLYVRETWRSFSAWSGYHSGCEIEYKAGGIQRFDKVIALPTTKGEWKPSIHMPKEAARIFLRVTDVRLERLQNIITGDYKTPININKEGLILSCCFCAHHNGDCKDYISQHSPKTLTCKLLEDFTLLWNSTIKKSDLSKYGWNANPWVWVIEFERIGEI